MSLNNNVRRLLVDSKLTVPPQMLTSVCSVPWILKRGGLETSGQRLISLNSKTNVQDFLFCIRRNLPTATCCVSASLHKFSTVHDPSEGYIF